MSAKTIYLAQKRTSRKPLGSLGNASAMHRISDLHPIDITLATHIRFQAHTPCSPDYELSRMPAPAKRAARA
jgi:hypothetical protein